MVRHACRKTTGLCLHCTGLAVVVRAAVTADPKTRVVITGQGVASVFGNDVDTFYNTCAPLLYIKVQAPGF